MADNLNLRINPNILFIIAGIVGVAFSYFLGELSFSYIHSSDACLNATVKHKGVEYTTFFFSRFLNFDRPSVVNNVPSVLGCTYGNEAPTPIYLDLYISGIFLVAFGTKRMLLKSSKD